MRPVPGSHRSSIGTLLAAVTLLGSAGCGGSREDGLAASTGGGAGRPQVAGSTTTAPNTVSSPGATAPAPPQAASGTGNTAPGSTPISGTGGAAPPAPSLEEVQRATAQVEMTVAQQPTDFNIRMQAATFYMRAGMNARAIPHLEAAGRLSPRAELPWIALGDAHTLLGKFDAARKAYDRAAKIKPNNSLLIRGQGQLELAQEHFKAARTVLERGLKLHPEDLEIRVALGNLYLVVNKPRLAVETLLPAIKEAPDNPGLHSLLADAYERDLHLESAIKELEVVTRLDPTMHEAWGRTGLYLVNLARYSEARKPLERAIQLFPGESHYHGTLADSYLLDHSSPDNFETAVGLYQKALELDPKNEKALYSYAMGLTRRGRPEDLSEASGLLKRLLAMDEKDSNVHFKLAETLRRMGQVEDAKKHQKRFRELFELGRKQTRTLYARASFEDTAEAHLKLARGHRSRGNAVLAAKEYRLALDRDPGLSLARAELQALGAVAAADNKAPKR